jgi:protoporphyrinogen/coproporphyrinogen III oxidase
MSGGAIIIGGGIAGLAAAHRAVELTAQRGAPAPVTVLEAASRAGGSVATERVDGFLVEAGADSFLTEKPWALDLCRRLGIEDRLVATRDAERRTFVVRDGRLYPLPEGFILLAPTRLWPLVRSPLFSLAGKLRMACDLVLPRGGDRGDESLSAFVTRRLGREALERVAQPLMGGIYTGDPERLSVAATMPRLLDMERRDRSLILAMRRQASVTAAVAKPTAGAAGGTSISTPGTRGATSGARWSLFASFAEGMETFVTALTRRLPEGGLRLGARVVAIRPMATPPSGVSTAATRRWEVMLANGERLESDAVVIATPAFVTADLLRPLDASLAAELDAIAYASSATVTVAYARGDVPHALDGFGFVVPAVERRRLIACSFSSVKYPGRAPVGAALLRVFCGGALAAAMAELTDAELVDAARDELRALLGIRAEPRLVRVHRHARAMPQYHVGHLARVAAIDAAVARLPGLALAGNAYRGVGIPDCVHGGEAAIERVLGAS